MLSNLIAQLKEVGAENRLDDVWQVERVRSGSRLPALGHAHVANRWRASRSQHLVR